MKKLKLKKKISALAALILAIALSTGGTYALLTSAAIVPALEDPDAPSVLLHNDFEAYKNLDVYVENTGGKDIYVRLQFREFLQIGNNVVLGGDRNNEDTWHIYTPDCNCIAKKYYTWNMSGNSKIYRPGHMESYDEKYTLGQSFEDGIYAKSTLPKTDLISFDEYMENRAIYDSELNARWVIDTDRLGILEQGAKA